MRFSLLLLTGLSFACAHVEPAPVPVPASPDPRAEPRTRTHVEGKPVVVTARPPRVEPPPPPAPRKNVRVAAVARRFLKNKTRLQRNDCSGLVISVFRELDIKVVGGTKQMWERALKEKRVRARPQVGDLAFFDHTWDKNKNGRVDDPLSHVAIVTVVDGDQVEMVHKIPSGIRRLRLNLSEKRAYKSDGVVRNDYLRARRYGPKGGPRMAGQLLRGFAAPPGTSSLATR